MALLQKKTVCGPMWYRDLAGENWDLKIIDEVITGDCYGLAKSPPISFALDVGGHIGSFAVALKHHHPGAKVISFEPFFDNYEILERNTASLEGAQAENIAIVGGPEHEIGFQPPGVCSRPDLNTGDGRLMPSSSFKVRARRLSEFMVGVPSVDILKLDCEGAEIQILEALAKVGDLPRVKRIVGEWHFDNAYEKLEAILWKTHTFEWSRLVVNGVGLNIGMFESKLRS
jgi:FkbM family methyltransferase